MSEILWILRKDVRRLWPLVAATLGFAALAGVVDAVSPIDNISQPTVEALWCLVCVFLAASLIEEERPHGHEQFWLTRPYSRGLLLAEKAVFLVLFAGLPRLAAQSIALWVNGVPPGRYAIALLASGPLFGIAVALVAGAVSAVTATLPEFLWTAVAVAAVIVGGWFGGSGAGRVWGNVEWLRGVMLGAIGVALVAAVLTIQYGWRRTGVARGLLAGGTVLAAALPLAGSWHTGFVLQSALTGRHAEAAAVALRFDAARGRMEGFGYPQPGRREVALPFTSTGGRVLVEGIDVEIHTPAGTVWRSGWTRSGVPDDSGWIHLHVDSAVYDELVDASVEVHGLVALTLLAGPQRASLAPRGLTRGLPDDGVCGIYPAAPKTSYASCAWPFLAPARAYAAGGVLLPPASYGWRVLTGALWQHAFTSFGTPTEPVPLETWQAVTHFERPIDIPAVRLRDYAVRRITDPQ